MGHGVERIAYAENFCAVTNARVFNSLRVTAAIGSFVMLIDNLCARLQAFCRQCHFVGLRGMLFDLFKFIFIQFFLIEDFIAEPDHGKIVQVNSRFQLVNMDHVVGQCVHADGDMQDKLAATFPESMSMVNGLP